MNDLRQRLRSDGGFTLVELLVVLVVIGALIGIAVPVYVGFTGRASDRTAQADIRAAVSSAESFYEANSTYSGMTVADLRSFDSGVSPDVAVATGPGKPTATGYCLTATVDGATWSVSGPGLRAWYGTADCTGAKVSP